jgi:hypothetical protein
MHWVSRRGAYTQSAHSPSAYAVSSDCAATSSRFLSSRAATAAPTRGESGGVPGSSLPARSCSSVSSVVAWLWGLDGL